VFVDDRVVVEVHGDWSSALPGHVVVDGVVPPPVERLVVPRSQELVVKPQTEAGTAQSKGPDLGVLAMNPIS